MSTNAGVAVCAIVKDEGPYLAEWLAYHIVAGAGRFHLYDNESRMPVAKTVLPFQQLVPIEVVPFPGRARQMDAYTDCLAHARGRDAWVAFVDVDEFLVPTTSWTIGDALRPYGDAGGVGVNWQTFGSSGHLRRPEGLQIAAFTRRAPLSWGWNKHIKTIARPERAVRAMNPHYFSYAAPWFCMNERREKVPASFNEPVSVGVLQVNHYFTRSREEYDEKVRRGAADGTFKSMEFWNVVEAAATESDNRILRFLPAVKSILKDMGPVGSKGAPR